MWNFSSFFVPHKFFFFKLIKDREPIDSFFFILRKVFRFSPPTLSRPVLGDKSLVLLKKKFLGDKSKPKEVRSVLDVLKDIADKYSRKPGQSLEDYKKEMAKKFKPRERPMEEVLVPIKRQLAFALWAGRSKAIEHLAFKSRESIALWEKNRGKVNFFYRFFPLLISPRARARAQYFALLKKKRSFLGHLVLRKFFTGTNWTSRIFGRLPLAVGGYYPKSSFFFNYVNRLSFSPFRLRWRLLQQFGSKALRFFRYGRRGVSLQREWFKNKLIRVRLKIQYFAAKKKLLKPFSFYQSALFFNYFKYGSPFLNPAKLLVLRRFSFFEKPWHFFSNFRTSGLAGKPFFKYNLGFQWGFFKNEKRRFFYRPKFVFFFSRSFYWHKRQFSSFFTDYWAVKDLMKLYDNFMKSHLKLPRRAASIVAQHPSELHGFLMDLAFLRTRKVFKNPEFFLTGLGTLSPFRGASKILTSHFFLRFKYLFKSFFRRQFFLAPFFNFLFASFDFSVEVFWLDHCFFFPSIVFPKNFKFLGFRRFKGPLPFRWTFLSFFLLPSVFFLKKLSFLLFHWFFRFSSFSLGSTFFYRRGMFFFFKRFFFPQDFLFKELTFSWRELPLKVFSSTRPFLSKKNYRFSKGGKFFFLPFFHLFFFLKSFEQFLSIQGFFVFFYDLKKRLLQKRNLLGWWRCVFLRKTKRVFSSRFAKPLYIYKILNFVRCKFLKILFWAGAFLQIEADFFRIIPLSRTFLSFFKTKVASFNWFMQNRLGYTFNNFFIFFSFWRSFYARSPSWANFFTFKFALSKRSTAPDFLKINSKKYFLLKIFYKMFLLGENFNKFFLLKPFLSFKKLKGVFYFFLQLGTHRFFWHGQRQKWVFLKNFSNFSFFFFPKVFKNTKHLFKPFFRVKTLGSSSNLFLKYNFLWSRRNFAYKIFVFFKEMKEYFFFLRHWQFLKKRTLAVSLPFIGLKNNNNRRAFFSLEKFVFFSFFYLSKPLGFLHLKYKFSDLSMQRFFQKQRLFTNLWKFQEILPFVEIFKLKSLAWSLFFENKNHLFYAKNSQLVFINSFWSFLTRPTKRLIKIYASNHWVLTNFSSIFNNLVGYSFYLKRFFNILKGSSNYFYRYFFFQNKFKMSFLKNHWFQKIFYNFFHRTFFKSAIKFFYKLNL